MLAAASVAAPPLLALITSLVDGVACTPAHAACDRRWKRLLVTSSPAGTLAAAEGSTFASAAQAAEGIEGVESPFDCDGEAAGVELLELEEYCVCLHPGTRADWTAIRLS